MAEKSPVPLVVPFRAERYTAREALSLLLAPPYDVITSSERAALARSSRHNVVHVILPEGDGDRYARAAACLAEWRHTGVLSRDSAPTVTVLRQEFTGRDGKRFARLGVVGAVAVEPFTAGRVQPHEKTHSAPKADRLALLRATKTVFDALLMLSRDEHDELRGLLDVVASRGPDGRVELGDGALGLWRVSGSEGAALARSAGSGRLYIADGHHRYETAMAYANANPWARRTLALIVPKSDPGLVVLPTHRVVFGDPVACGTIVGQLREHFLVRDLAANEDLQETLTAIGRRGTACAVVLRERVLLLVMKGGAARHVARVADHPAVARLDVARVDELVVRALLTAAGPSARLSYTPHEREVLDAANRGAAAGVLLRPPKVDAVMAVADAGATMPQKSTYFAPKVPSGLMFLPLE